MRRRAYGLLGARSCTSPRGSASGAGVPGSCSRFSTPLMPSTLRASAASRSAHSSSATSPRRWAMPPWTSTLTSPFGASGARKISVSTLRASVTSSGSSRRVGDGRDRARRRPSPCRPRSGPATAPCSAPLRAADVVAPRDGAAARRGRGRGRGSARRRRRRRRRPGMWGYGSSRIAYPRLRARKRRRRQNAYVPDASDLPPPASGPAAAAAGAWSAPRCGAAPRAPRRSTRACAAPGSASPEMRR